MTVFAAPEKMVDTSGLSVHQIPLIKEISPEETDERVKGLSRLIAGVTKTLLCEDVTEVEVTVTLKLHHGDKKNEKLSKKQHV